MIGAIGRLGDIGSSGDDVASLLQDVYGSGRDAEDLAPRVVAGWRSPAGLEPPVRADGGRDFRPLAGLMEMPLAALGDRAPDNPVWYCRLRAAPQDRPLADDEWAQIARDVMDRTGLSPAGQAAVAVPWVAVGGGGDRVHIVATLARQDAGNPRLTFDWHHVSEACRAAEERYGLWPAVARPGGTGRPGAARPGSAELDFPPPPPAAAPQWPVPPASQAPGPPGPTKRTTSSPVPGPRPGLR
jgi:hypothetical protein